jgi:hypothetical protein
MYSLPNIIKVNKSRMRRLEDLVAYLRMRNPYKIPENLKGKDHLKDLGADGKKTLKWILKKSGMDYN